MKDKKFLYLLIGVIVLVALCFNFSYEIERVKILAPTDLNMNGKTQLGSGYAKDEHFVYFLDYVPPPGQMYLDIVEKADPNNFEILPGGDYARDAHHVYHWGNITSDDVKTFQPPKP